jgi:hypothetical protein
MTLDHISATTYVMRREERFWNVSVLHRVRLFILVTLQGASSVHKIFVKNYVFSHRCDQAGENGVTRLASVRCPNGLAFDIERQTCDWKTNVKNCNKIESK